jgi:arylsulfatase A-like enzyme
MADEAIQYMKQLKEIAPDKPFFVYYVPGGTHAPHNPTPRMDQEDQRYALVR